jgi:hypothetical protein
VKNVTSFADVNYIDWKIMNQNEDLGENYYKEQQKGLIS